ncbi:cadmium/zinc-transporting ATPase HMA3-like [Nymphaea colorata]|nr:cadmium/zinc-transporting ATPase HMA3-like [Nymphaea colorata]XP_031500219.1 cadmium/zinc-transporting ATPase HMA3-like [Nymphaea colorata]
MEGELQKSYFEVLGICCPSEIPLIERTLKPLDGVHKVSVSVPTKTVTVVHNSLLTSQTQIVKALNQARLNASVRSYGGKPASTRSWPSLYTVGSGLLLIPSFFKGFYGPLQWLALAAVLVGLPPVILRSYAAIQRLVLDINILLLIAVGGAVGLGDYQEAGTIVFLFTFAEWLESRASDKARDMMSNLMKEMPQNATIAETGAVVHPNEVNLGTVLVVKAGEVIPIDGAVVNGMSEVDEKSLTGESTPVEKTVGSLVWGGTMNLTGYINMKTTALAEDSAVAKMAKLVEEAHQNRSKTQRIVDEFAKYYTPTVVIASVGLAVLPAILRAHNLQHWVYLSLVVLVSACPCALVLSTPVATECALRRAASIGLLIKGGDHLESLARVKVVAFDKTGTMTCGKFAVSHFHLDGDAATRDKLLYWLSSLERKSNHPMASALVEYSRLNSIEACSDNVKDFHIVPGEGISGEIDGTKVCVGNKRMAQRLGCHVNDEGEDDRRRGVTMGYVMVDGKMAANFGVCDECRPGAKAVVQQLRSLGIKTAMLTGDSQVAAMHVQEELGNSIDFVHAELLPAKKVSIIEDLKKLGPTAMVGDGMNDAPALATATVGIAMGVSGSAIATETSHVTLMSNDIGKIAIAIKLGRRTHRKIIQNIVLSVATKAVILGLAFGGHPRLWAAILADVGTCLLVILNSMLLLLQGHNHMGKCKNQTHSPHTHTKTCAPCDGHTKHTSHVHLGCFPCAGHCTHNYSSHGTCKEHDTCKASARPSAHSEDHEHTSCITNCHGHLQQCSQSEPITCATYGGHSAPCIGTCKHPHPDESSRATDCVAMCKHSHKDECKGTCNNGDGGVSNQIDAIETVQDPPAEKFQERSKDACKCPSSSVSKTNGRKKSDECGKCTKSEDTEHQEVLGSSFSGMENGQTCCAKGMGDSRCCRTSCCRPRGGACIHAGTLLTEIIVE